MSANKSLCFFVKNDFNISFKILVGFDKWKELKDKVALPEKMYLSDFREPLKHLEWLHMKTTTLFFKRIIRCIKFC